MKIKYIIGILLFITTSCSGFLEESSQDTAYLRGYVDLDETLLGEGYMEVTSANSLGNGQMSDFYYPYIHFMADDTQENISYGNSWFSDNRRALFGYYTWQRRVGMNVEGTLREAESRDWDRLYKHINITNMVIEAIDKQSAPTTSDKMEVKRIKGEAHFLRAAYYFTLVNLYGKPYLKTTADSDPGVPLKLTNYIEDVKFNRNSVAEIYEQVVKDLQIAESCLEQTSTKSIYRADIAATYLLKSRVYLYMQEYESAKDYARKALEKKKALIDLNNFDKTKQDFLSAQSVETIFSMGTSVTQYVATGRTEDFGISDDLYAQYAPFQGNEDLRKVKFMTVMENHVAYGKLTVRKSGRIDVSDNFLFRTAEAYLNLAEAAACSGDETSALEALNTLRLNRMDHTGYVKVNLHGADLVKFIRDERRRELCLEGHRWFDLRRYMVNEKFPYTKTIRNSYTQFIEDEDSWFGEVMPIETHIYELKEKDPAYTLPIPIEVLGYNDGMKDNVRVDRPIVEVITY